MLLNLKHDLKDCNNYIFFLIIIMAIGEKPKDIVLGKKIWSKTNIFLMKMVNQLRKQNRTKYIKKDTYLLTRRKKK